MYYVIIVSAQGEGGKEEAEVQGKESVWEWDVECEHRYYGWLGGRPWQHLH